MKLAGTGAQYRSRPCPASLRIADHLDLINDSNVHLLTQWSHLHSVTINAGRVIRYSDLVTRNKATWYSFSVQTRIYFMSEQPQGSRIKSRFRCFKLLKRM